MYSDEYYAQGDTERRLELSLDRSKLQPRLYFLGKPSRDLETALRRRGWTAGSAEEAHFLWLRSRQNSESVRTGVIVNHLTGSQNLTAKSLLLSCLRGCRPASFFPRSFTLPQEFPAFKRNFHRTQLYYLCNEVLEKGHCSASDLEVINVSLLALESPTWSSMDLTNPREKQLLQRLKTSLQPDVQTTIDGSGSLWIVKPARKSRGRGISVHKTTTSVEEAVQDGHSYVVQKYVEQPLLFHERKFDLRVWAVVLGFALEIWVYDLCYARFSVHTYDPANLHNRYVHLTNNSVSKHAPDFESSLIPGCMWSLEQLRAHFRTHYSPGLWSMRLWPQICAIVERTVKSAPWESREAAFVLLGFDFLIAEDFKVWLLEVNASPSLQHSTAVTAALVPAMLEDLLTLVLGETPLHFQRLSTNAV